MRKVILSIAILVFAVGLVACSTPDTTQTQTSDSTADTPSETDSQTDTQPETNEETTTTGDGDVQVVEVEAYQFGWDPNPIRVEAGRPVRLELSSRDVAHGIAIPELGVSQRIPRSGETVTTEFTPEQTGEFNFICSVYCGRGHSAMSGRLIVE